MTDEQRRRSTDRVGDDWHAPGRADPGDDVVTRSLIAAIGSLGADIRTLIGAVASDRRTRKTLLAALSFAVAMLVVVGTFGAVFTVRAGRIQAEQERQGVELHDITRRFIECTTPGDAAAVDPDDHVHECFDASQASQAKAVADIVDTNGNGIPDTQELLANQAAAAKARGLDLPYPQLEPATTTTTVKH